MASKKRSREKELANKIREKELAGHAKTFLKALTKVSIYLDDTEDLKAAVEEIKEKETDENVCILENWIELLEKKETVADDLVLPLGKLVEAPNALFFVRRVANGLRDKRFDGHPLNVDEWDALLKVTKYRKQSTKGKKNLKDGKNSEIRKDTTIDASSTTAQGESNVVLGSVKDRSAGRDNFKVVDNSQRNIGSQHFYKRDDQSSSGSQKETAAEESALLSLFPVGDEKWDCEVSCLADVLARKDIRCHVISDPAVFNKLRELAGTLLKNRKIMGLITDDQYQAVTGLATDSRNISTGDEKIKNILVGSQQTTNKVT